MNAELANTLANVLIVLGLFPVVAFPVLYQKYTRGNWRKSLVGRQTMQLWVSMLLLVINSTLNGVVGLDYPARPFVRFIIFGFVVAALYHSLWVLWMVQKHPERYPVRLERRKSDSNSA